MAASTVNLVDSYRPSGGANARLKMAVESIPYGAMVMINAAGYVANSTDTIGCFFLGIALEAVDNSAGSAGDLSILVDIGGASVKCTHEDGSMAQANVGDAVVQELNNEVTSAGTGTNDIAVGKISDIVSATVVWVKCASY